MKIVAIIVAILVVLLMVRPHSGLKMSNTTNLATGTDTNATRLETTPAAHLARRGAHMHVLAQYERAAVIDAAITETLQALDLGETRDLMVAGICRRAWNGSSDDALALLAVWS